MPPIGRRTVLKLVTGGVAAAAVPWATLPWAHAATRLPTGVGKAVAQDDVLAIAFDGALRTRLARQGSFVTGWQSSESLLLAEGQLSDFAYVDQHVEALIDPRHGPGQRTRVRGRAGNGVEKEVEVTFFQQHPGLALLQVAYINAGAQPLPVRGWRSAAHELEARPGGFWSFSGATHTDRRDWVQPLDEAFGHDTGFGRQRLPGEGGMDGFFVARLKKR